MARVLAHAPNKEPLAGAQGRGAGAVGHACALAEKGCLTDAWDTVLVQGWQEKPQKTESEKATPKFCAA